MKPSVFASALLALVAAFGLGTVTALAATATIASGENRDGAIAAGGSDTWVFRANEHDHLLVRLAKKTPTDNFAPHLRVFAPNGALVGEQVNDDCAVTHRATQTGNYTAVVTGYYPDNAGAYRMRLLQFPAPLTIPAGDEGGPLVSGQNHDGVLELGDMDAWTFSAAAGNVLLFRVGKLPAPGNFTPHIRLYGPDGALLGEGADSSDTGIPHVATAAGLYTVVISGYYGGDTGAYRLRAVKLPGTVATPVGDEGGSLTSSYDTDGVIALGDIDAFTIPTSQGAALLLRLAKLSGNLTPRLTLYGPNGALVADNANSTDAAITHTTTQQGNYVVIVTGYYTGDTGAYRLRFQTGGGPVNVPVGDEGGPLTSGLDHDGALDIGDIDTFTLSAASDETIFLRLGRTPAAGNITPHIRLYAPNGALVAEQANANNAAITHRATQTGAYLAVVTSYYAGDTGTYRLRYLKAPETIATPAGDEGGILNNNQIVDGAFPLGDIDAWIIAATAGTPVSISLSKQLAAASLTPYLAIYDYTGAQVAAQADGTTAVVNFTPTVTGLYTVVAQGYYADDTGAYRLAISGVTTPLPPPTPVATGSRHIPPTKDLYGVSVVASGTGPLRYRWRRNGIDFPGSGTASLVFGANPAAGVYSAVVSNLVGSSESNGVVIGVDIAGAGLKVFGHAYEFASNIAHPNGNIYDQILLTGDFGVVRADPGQIVRTSYIDLNDDIVQIEFSGPGSLTINLAGASGPAIAAKYNQPGVQYMKGHASLTLVEADETTHLSVFTVGSITAVNQALFKPTETYDGVADLGLLAIQPSNPRLGSIRFANAEFFDAAGLTGVFAPGIRIGGPANIHNISAVATATPLLLTGTIDTGRIGITGGDMLQINSKPVQVGDTPAIAMLAGATSHGVPQPAQINKAQYERNGVNVTAQLIQTP